MRKILSVLLLLVLFLLGCKNDTEKKVLTIIGEDSSTLTAINELKNVYEKENNIEVKVVALPFEESMEKSNLDLSNGTGLYDIILQYNFSLSSFVRNDYVYSLDELKQYVDSSDLDFENDLFQSDWEEVGYYYKEYKKPELGSKKVGYPFASNTRLIVYNKEWFENKEYQKAFKQKYNKELAVPTTWEDVKQIAEFFTRPDKKMYGICLEGAEGGWLYYQWVDMLYGLGGNVMDKDKGWKGDLSTKVNLDSPQALSTMKTLKALKAFNKGDFFDVDMYKQKELVKKGDVAMAIMWSDILYDLIDLKATNHQFGFAPAPGNLSMNAGGAFFINKDTKNASEAMKFITWLMKEQNQVAMLNKGLCSPRKSVYKDDKVKNIPYLNALEESLNRGVYMAEAGPDADVVSQNITTYAQKVWKGDLEPKQAIKELQAKVKTEREEIFKQLK